MVDVLEHVENDVSSIFKLKFHWYDVYRNRLHELSDNKKKLLRVVAVLRACLSVCIPTVTGMPAKFRLVMLVRSALIANCIEHYSGYLRIRECFSVYL